MISLHLARRLEAAGVPWVPGDGDRFMIPDRDLDDVIFVVSHMVVEVDVSPVGPILKFNGTTEWALDIVESRDALWLPREDQLRVMLGAHFVSLTTTRGGYAVVVEHEGREQRHEDLDAECAYARAVLAVRRGPSSAER